MSIDTTAAPDIASVAEIQRGIDAMFEPSDIIEVRIPKATIDGRKCTIAGTFYASSVELAQTIANSSGKHPNIYYTLNPIDPALGQPLNEVARASSTTNDGDIAWRNKFLIDCDPIRVAEVSATDEEKEHSRVQARAVVSYLKSLGWPIPLVADSGNGYHVIPRIDLPNDKASTALIKSVLKSLATKFDTPESKIDQGVYNAARIVKAYGSLAGKGENTEARPHRLSKLLKPGNGIVSREQLEAIAAEVIEVPSSEVSIPQEVTDEAKAGFEKYLGPECHNVDFTEIGWDEAGQRWEYSIDAGCPFRELHTNPDTCVLDKEFYVYISPTGPQVKCVHSSCEMTWGKYRDYLIEKSGRNFPMTAGGVTVGAAVGLPQGVVEMQDEPAETELQTESDAMPDAVLDGRLGDICEHRLHRFPRDYAWIAMVVCAGTLVPRTKINDGGVLVGVPDSKPRTNLYGGLLGRTHTGKSAVIEQAQYTLGMKDGQPNKEFLLDMKSGSAEGLVRVIGDNGGGSLLYSPDELSHLLDKVAIAKSSFQSVLNTAFDKNRQRFTLAQGKDVVFNCRFSLLGGIVEEKFDQCFGENTTGGLYDRFIFGHYKGTKEHLYRLPDETAEDLTPVAVTFGDDVLEASESWITEEHMNPRVRELALRVAVICASFDGRSVLRSKDLGPAHAFAQYQERVRQMYAPNCGENPIAHIAIKVRRFLEKHWGKAVSRSQLQRGIHVERLGPGNFDATIKAMLRNTDITMHKVGSTEYFILAGASEKAMVTTLKGDSIPWENRKVKFTYRKEK